MSETLERGVRGRTGLIVLLGTLTAFAPLSIDMYLPAFPAIAADLGVSGEAVQQTLAVFFLGMAMGQLVYGPLSDRFGRKPPLLAGIVIYGIASVGCALATSVSTLVIARFCQALGGCAGVVIARAVVRDRFHPRDAAEVYSRLMLVMGAAPILAPVLGGQMLGVFGWRAIFWTLAAFAIACAAMVAFGLRESHEPDSSAGHPIRSFGIFAQILADRTFRWPALTVALSTATLFAYITSSPLVFIEHFGVPAARYALFFGANALIFIAASHMNAVIVRRVDPQIVLRHAVRAMAAIGVVLGGCVWFEPGGLWGTATLLALLLAALGFVGANGAAIAMHHQGRHAGSASALLGTMQFAVSALVGTGVAWVGASMHSPLRAMGVVIAACVASMLVTSRLSPDGGRAAD